MTTLYFCCPPNASETKRESREARGGYRTTCPKGIRGGGGDRRARIETEQEQLNPGEFPKTLMPCTSVHRYQACTWTRTYNSISCSTVSLRDLFVLRIQTDIARISLFLFSLYNAQRLEYFFSIYKFYYLHQNLTIIIKVQKQTHTMERLSSRMSETFLELRLIHYCQWQRCRNLLVIDEVQMGRILGQDQGLPSHVELLLANVQPALVRHPFVLSLEVIQEWPFLLTMKVMQRARRLIKCTKDLTGYTAFQGYSFIHSYRVDE
jgi:hypothetical protein